METKMTKGKKTKLLKHNPNDIDESELDENVFVYDAIFCIPKYKKYISEVYKTLQLRKKMSKYIGNYELEDVHLSWDKLHLFINCKKGIAYLNIKNGLNNPVIIWHKINHKNADDDDIL